MYGCCRSHNDLIQVSGKIIAGDKYVAELDVILNCRASYYAVCVFFLEIYGSLNRTSLSNVTTYTQLFMVHDYITSMFISFW